MTQSDCDDCAGRDRDAPLSQRAGKRTADGGYYYTARGHLGQRITVFPEDRLVIVRFGINEEGVDSWDKVIETVAAKAR